MLVTAPRRVTSQGGSCVHVTFASQPDDLQARDVHGVNLVEKKKDPRWRSLRVFSVFFGPFHHPSPFNHTKCLLKLPFDEEENLWPLRHLK